MQLIAEAHVPALGLGDVTVSVNAAPSRELAGVRDRWTACGGELRALWGW